MGNRVDPTPRSQRPQVRTLSEALGTCAWGPACALLIGTKRYWEIQTSKRPPSLNQNQLLTVALRLARIDETSPRFPKVLETQCHGVEARVVVEAVAGHSLIHALSPGSYSIHGWAFALREMLCALRELQYVGLSHGRIDTQSFRRQDDGRIVLDFFQPLAYAELPGESTHVYSLKSPERNREISFPVGLPSDLFAVGQLAKTIFERGIKPDILANDSRVPLIEGILARLTAFDPQDRYAHPESALHDLERLTEPEVGEHGPLDPLRRESLPRKMRLIGRQSERYRLTQAWRRAGAGQRDPVLVVGPSASGRSELLLHHHRDLLLAGHFSVFLSPNVCGPTSRGFLHGLLRSIDQRCAVRNESDKLKDILSGELQEFVRINPSLRARFGTPNSDRAEQPDVPFYQRLLTELLSNLAPIAIIIDDAERCPGLASELFAGLVEQTVTRGVHWVASASKTLLAWAKHPQEDRNPVLTLGPQDHASSLALLRQHLGSNTIPDRLCEFLGYRQNDPWFMPLKAVDAALDQGLLYRKNNAWQLQEKAFFDHAQSGLRPLIVDTGSSLGTSAPARSFLLRCAALGPGVALDPMLDILSPNGEGARWLEYAVRMGAIVCYSDNVHRFAEQDFISKLLDPLPAAERRKIHGELYSALSDPNAPNSIPRRSELCAEQGYLAQLHMGERQRILLDAIKRALKHQDQEALERWYKRWQSRTPEPIENIQDAITLSEAAQRLGNPIQAHQELRQALEIATTRIETAQLKLNIAKVSLFCNDLDLAAHHASQGLALLRGNNAKDIPATPETIALRTHLQLFLCASCMYTGPVVPLLWNLLQIWSMKACRVSAGTKLQLQFILGVILIRIAPYTWVNRVSIWAKRAQHKTEYADPELRSALEVHAMRNRTILSALSDDPLATFRSYNRWRSAAAYREPLLTRRTIILGVRMMYANLGAYALARDTLAQLPINDKYQGQDPSLPSVLSCSIYNTHLALGESMPSRAPIPFKQAPRGSQSSLMALEIERLCHLGELDAAQSVAKSQEELLREAPLLELPISQQLSYVHLAYGLLSLALTRSHGWGLSELKALRKKLGRRIGTAPSHSGVLRAFELYFAGQYNAALSTFDRAEAIATRQRALLALHWIERGRAHVAVAQEATSNRIAKLVQGAIHYAEQMPSPRLREQTQEVFGHHLRAARAWTGQSSDHLAMESKASIGPRAGGRSLYERFTRFQENLAKSSTQGSSMFAFLDALLQETQAKRVALFRQRCPGVTQLLAARDRQGKEIELDFQYDEELVQRCLESKQVQHDTAETTSPRKIRSALASPYFQHGQVAGVIYLDDPDCHYRFDHSDLSLVAGLAPQLPLLLDLEQLASSSKQHGIELIGLQAQSEHFAQALAISEKKRKQILTYVREPVILIDAAHGAILELSAAARELLRDSDNKLIGTHYLELFPNEGVPARRDTFSKAVTNGKALLTNETLHFAGCQPIPVNVHLRRLEFGDLRAVQATFESLQERNHLQEQIRKAQKVEAMGTLASGIVHDFNNFLSAIGSVAESLPAQDSKAEPFNKRSLILDTVEQASQLTRQMLDLTRERRPQPTAINLDAHIDRVINLLRPSLGPDIQCNILKPEEPSVVYIDQSELTQIILNLTINARDAMPNGGTLTIQSTRMKPHDRGWERFDRLDTRPYRVLRFQDTGTGIPEALLEKIFEAFFTTKSTGNGLGLASVQELVTRNQGSIAVQSQVYQGTTFEVALPEFDRPQTQVYTPQSVLNARPTPKTHRAPEPRSSSHTAERPEPGQLSPLGPVLYVEDNAIIRELSCEVLRGAGYELHAFESGDQALEWFNSHRPNLALLLTDVNLPGINGQELYRVLRRSLPQLPVLYLTGAASDELMATSDDDSDTSEPPPVLQKPFSTRTLLKTIRDTLDNAI